MNPLKSAPATARRIIKELNLTKNTNWDRNPHRLASREKNGIGHYTLPIQKLVINYDSSIGGGGSSTGTVAWIKRDLLKFCSENPSIEVVVQPAPHQHPVAKALYANGSIKYASLANLGTKDVKGAIHTLRNTSGEKERQWTKPVISDASITSQFDPFALNRLK
jgi:hypothetical protein